MQWQNQILYPLPTASRPDSTAAEKAKRFPIFPLRPPRPTKRETRLPSPFPTHARARAASRRLAVDVPRVTTVGGRKADRIAEFTGSYGPKVAASQLSPYFTQ